MSSTILPLRLAAEPGTLSLFALAARYASSMPPPALEMKYPPPATASAASIRRRRGTALKTTADVTTVDGGNIAAALR
jgi:hypothetical protein